MATRILFAPKQPDAVMEIARRLTPPGFELVVADIGSPEFYEAAPTVEFYLGLARQMGGEFFRSASKLKLMQTRHASTSWRGARWGSSASATSARRSPAAPPPST